MKLFGRLVGMQKKKKKKNHQERKEGKGNTWVRRTLRQLRSPVEAAK